METQQKESSSKIENKSSKKTSVAVVVMVLVIASVIASVIVLRFVPLKYEEEHYRDSATVEPQQTKSLWVIVPKGYAVSGSYGVSSANPVELTVSFQSSSTYLSYNVVNEQGTSGSFSFEAQEVAVDERYTFNFRNPASSGLFGIGAGSTITVTVDFTVSGWTTYLK